MCIFENFSLKFSEQLFCRTALGGFFCEKEWLFPQKIEQAFLKNQPVSEYLWISLFSQCQGFNRCFWIWLLWNLRKSHVSRSCLLYIEPLNRQSHWNLTPSQNATCNCHRWDLPTNHLKRGVSRKACFENLAIWRLIKTTNFQIS